MGQIITFGKISALAKSLRSARKNVILAGGCFDILHLGHIRFLQKAKTLGGILIVLLESDERVAKKKGEGRPIYPQQVRAQVLASLEGVDYVIMLPYPMGNDRYDDIIKKLRPQFLATTKGDPKIHHKKRGAALVGAQIKYVTALLQNFSTGSIIEKLK